MKEATVKASGRTDLIFPLLMLEKDEVGKPILVT